MTAISDIESEDLTPAGLDWVESEKAAGGATDSKKLLINNLMRADHLLQNTWQGKASLNSLTTGTGNTGTGENSLTALMTGGNNTAVGYGALAALVSSNNCVAVGKDALLLATGADNIGIGVSAGNIVTSGSANICIGRDADTGSATSTDRIVIGTNINGTANDQCSIGKSGAITSNDFGSDAVWTSSSDRRKKRNIQDSKLGLAFINLLQPVTYNWRPASEWPGEWDVDPTTKVDTDTLMMGLVAQDVKERLDYLHAHRFAGWGESPNGQQTIAKGMFVFPLINAVNEITIRLEALERLKKGSKNHD